MKRYILLLFVLTLVVIMTGCSKKTEYIETPGLLLSVDGEYALTELQEKIQKEGKLLGGAYLGYILIEDEMKKDADIVVVFGGTNDYGHATIPLGTMDNEDITTFYGGMHHLCKYLIKEYVGKTIVFMTPIHRLEENADPNNETSRPLICFIKAIREVCEYYSIPVLDLYKESGMHGNVWAWCEKYMPDGLHPNDLGHEIIASKLQKFLERL